MKKNTAIITAIIITFLLLFSNNVSAQKKPMMIKQIKAIYKSKIDGRIISEKEFQSYRGVYTYHKLIKGKNGKDTMLISPPKKRDLDANTLKAANFKAQVGKKAKNFNVTDLYGNNISLDKLKGKTLVLNFWFVACPPCINEMPDLNRIVDSYQNNKDLRFISFALDKEEKLGRFLSKSKFNYEVVPDAKKISELFLVDKYPTHIIIDKNGIIKYLNIGLTDNSIQDLNKEIEKVL